MRAIFDANEKQVGDLELTLKVMMSFNEWAEVRDHLTVALSQNSNHTTWQFRELLRGLLNTQHAALNASYEIDPYKIKRVDP